MRVSDNKGFNDFPRLISIHKYSASSNSFADRALYIHALQNVGYGHTLDSMLEMAIKRAPLDDESANDLRVYIIKGLNPYKTQPKVKCA